MMKLKSQASVVKHYTSIAFIAVFAAAVVAFSPFALADDPANAGTAKTPAPAMSGSANQAEPAQPMNESAGDMVTSETATPESGSVTTETTTTETTTSDSSSPPEKPEPNIFNRILNSINGVLATVLFFDILFGSVKGGEFPFLVAWLGFGALFLTIRMGFVNLRMFRHAYRIIRGRYKKPDDEGEVTPFQALTTALSATVGLGNIAGVAIAIMIGGPGATFWMIIAGFLGMTAKFTEVTLAQHYRIINPKTGHVMGGAMEYLSRGFAERGAEGFGKVMAILFCICAIGGCIGGGNMFQVSQATAAVAQRISFFESNGWAFGVILAIIVAMVIIGGIRRIAHVAEAVVPTMVIIYVGACLWIILVNANMLPDVIGQIFSGAFTHEAGIGGVIGAIVQGFKRAVFSSEAGIGSAAIAHATAKTEYPVRQGIVALMEPFIDTVVICTMTAMVIVITGVVSDPANASIVAAKEGAALTSVAFGSVLSWFPIILTISVVLFAFSTMISWSYYGERCWSYLFGENTSMVFKVIFVLLIIVGSIASASSILDFSDLIFLSLAIPNYIGLYVMHGMVKQQLGEYETKLRAGEFDKASPVTA